MIRRGLKLGLFASLLCVLAGVHNVSAQGDPLELQRRAIQRIDAFVDQVRRTGDFRSALSELVQADRELAASNRALATRGAWPALALGLIKQGHIYRIQSQWQSAITFYQQAEEAAKRGANVSYQSDALAWRALAESSLRKRRPVCWSPRSSSRRPGTALRC